MCVCQWIVDMCVCQWVGGCYVCVSRWLGVICER